MRKTNKIGATIDIQIISIILYFLRSEIFDTLDLEILFIFQFILYIMVNV